MAKPKFPRKTSGGQDIVPPAITPTPLTNESTVIAETSPAVQARKPEPRPIEQKTDARKTEPKRFNGKPEIVKSEPRSNLIPINMDDEIRRLAYLISERRGFEPGHEAEDWLTAENEVRQRYHQQSA